MHGWEVRWGGGGIDMRSGMSGKTYMDGHMVNGKFEVV
jgi:hypothetical protein